VTLLSDLMVEILESSHIMVKSLEASDFMFPGLRTSDLMDCDRDSVRLIMSWFVA
jgi:hypothetical protein